jgi:ribonuclease D
MREQSSLKAFWYIGKNWRRVMAKRRDIMSRKRVDDEYMANWFRYSPVSAPASKPQSSKQKPAARQLAKSKAARG